MFSKRSGALCAVTVLALASVACGSTNSAESTDVADIDGAELERRLNEEGQTEELVALAEAYNERQLAEAVSSYKLEIAPGHDVLFIETDPGEIVTAERIGPEALDSEFSEQTPQLSPSEVFSLHRPGESVPTELLEMEERATDLARTLALADPVTASPDAEAAEDEGLPVDGLVLKHSTSSGTHFRDDSHNYDGVNSKACEDSTSATTQRSCWTNRTNGGYSQRKSTHVTYYFGLYDGNTSFKTYKNGSLKTDLMIFESELWRFTRSGPYIQPDCFPLDPFCSRLNGYNAVTHRAAWNGADKLWHFAAHYRDVFRLN